MMNTQKQSGNNSLTNYYDTFSEGKKVIYKGCQKRMIMLKNTGSEIFDEAYFILKEERILRSDVNENDMVREAGRIINENLLSSCCKRTSEVFSRVKLRMVLWYLAGAVS